METKSKYLKKKTIKFIINQNKMWYPTYENLQSNVLDKNIVKIINVFYLTSCTCMVGNNDKKFYVFIWGFTNWDCYHSTWKFLSVNKRHKPFECFEHIVRSYYQKKAKLLNKNCLTVDCLPLINILDLLG